jgi:hypothetical protein
MILASYRQPRNKGAVLTLSLIVNSLSDFNLSL